MDTKDVIKQQMEGNPELAKSLEEALRRNAGAEELSGILAGAGVDDAVADELLAEFQRNRGVEIGFEDLDPEAMEKVAGGVTKSKADGCIRDYYLETCKSTVDMGWCMSNDSCAVWSNTYNFVLHDGTITCVLFN